VSKWWDELDPNRDWREQAYIRQMEIYEAALEVRKLLEANATVDGSDDPDAPISIQTAPPFHEAATDYSEHARISNTQSTRKMQDKRQVVDGAPKSNQQKNSTSIPTRTSLNSTGIATRKLHTFEPLYSPAKPTSHEEFVKKRI